MKKQMKDLMIIFGLLIISSCTSLGKDYLIETIEFDTTVNYIDNVSASILLATRNGCPESNFEIKKAYYDEEKYKTNINIISTYLELEIWKRDYFSLPFLNNISHDFFEHNVLIFVLQNYSGGTYLKNGRFENKNGKYIFIIEHWGMRLRAIPACSYNGLYILKLPKINT
jgi:hypothetical protein